MKRYAQWNAWPLRVMRKPQTWLLLLALVWAAALCVQSARAFSPATISADNLTAHIKLLASDEFQGRRTGTVGMELAAQYLEQEFALFGLLPAGDNGTYRESFPVVIGGHLGTDNHMTVTQAGEQRALQLGKEYTPLTFSGNGRVVGDVVFAGYGITAPELNYDDYAGVDVKDKIVLILRYEPQEDSEQSVFAGRRPSRYSDLRIKVLNARNHGARAVIITTGPLLHEQEGEELMAFRTDYGGSDQGLPVVQVQRSVVDPWFTLSGFTLRQIQEAIDSHFGQGSFPLAGVSVDLAAEVIKDRASGYNVVGYLKGNDPAHAGEVIVIGAHYDHLGKGGPESLSGTDQIHHGADDNASGTAGVLELARVLSSKRNQIKHTILFICFGGEELGLIGSSYYVSHPFFPLDQTVFMLNLDMIGRLRDEKLVVSGLGTAAELGSMVQDANGSLGMNLAPDVSGIGGSDHTSFSTHNVPVLFLFTGIHSDYHKPSDTWDKINYPGMVRVLTFAYQVLGDVDDEAERMAFVSARGGAQSTGAPEMRVSLGIMPDYGEPPDPGLVISGVREGSPAEKAGLKAGDLIVKVAGKTIANIYDYMNTLAERKPGDTIEIVVKRSGQLVTVSATLAARGQ